MPVISGLGRWTQRGPGGSMTTRPSRVGDLQVQWQNHLKSKVGSDCEQYLTLNFGLHMCTHMCAGMHVHTYTLMRIGIHTNTFMQGHTEIGKKNEHFCSFACFQDFGCHHCRWDCGEKTRRLCPGADLQEPSDPVMRIQPRAAEAKVKCCGLWYALLLFEMFATHTPEGKWNSFQPHGWACYVSLGDPPKAW